MSGKHFIILVLLVLVIGGAGVAMFKRDTETWTSADSRLGQKVLPGLQISDIAQIHIEHKKDKLNVVDEGGTWRVKERGW